jgi:long-chain acyl-CoA synthetase
MGNQVQSGARIVPLEGVLRRGAQAARGFDSLGIGEGDSVALMLRNDICMMEATAGAGLLGAYPVPVNWHWKGEEAGYVLADCAAKAVVVHADLLPQIEGHIPAGAAVLVAPTPPEIAAAYAIADERCTVPGGMSEWDAWRDGFAPWDQPPKPTRGSMIYTSGTTGHPKGVRREPLEPERQAKSQVNAIRGFGIRPGCHVAMTGPMYHSAPAGYVRLAMQIGCSILLLPRFDPEDLLRAIDEHRITHMHVVPTMFSRMLKLPDEVRAKYDVSSLEWVVHGAAPCPPEIKRRMIEWWGPVIHEYYGSTEAGLVTVSTSEDWLSKPGTVGRPQPGVEVCIYDDEGNILPTGESGEIYMSLGPLSDFTYHNKDDKRREIGRGGFVTNGDVGYLDEDGYLFLNDRKRDMVISGGVNIYPAEIEAVLHDMPGVHDCAVFGIPDEDFGESLAAAVEPQPGTMLDQDEVRDYLRARIANYKVPKVITFHDALPREDSGKIFKRHLRDPYWQQAGRQI